MKPKLFVNKVYIQKSRIHGYGVYAGKTLHKGDKIEECYFIITKGGDKGLEDFYFDAAGKYAVPTGFGIVYNHSDEPNADYTFNMTKRVTTIKATTTIHKGEEIFVSYGKKWFKDRGIVPKEREQVAAKNKIAQKKKSTKKKVKSRKKRKSR